MFGCNETYKFREQRKRHMEKCEKPAAPNLHAAENKVYLLGPDNKFLCAICKMEFSQKPAVFKHFNKGRCKGNPMYDEKQQTSVEYSWNLCDRKFLYLSKLKRHKVTHEQDSFVCLICTKQFKRAHHFEKHSTSCDAVFPSFIANEKMGKTKHEGDSVVPENNILVSGHSYIENIMKKTH